MCYVISFFNLCNVIIESNITYYMCSITYYMIHVLHYMFYLTHYMCYIACYMHCFTSYMCRIMCNRYPGKYISWICDKHDWWTQMDHIWWSCRCCLDWEHEHCPWWQQKGNAHTCTHTHTGVDIVLHIIHYLPMVTIPVVRTLCANRLQQFWCVDGKGACIIPEQKETQQ